MQQQAPLEPSDSSESESHHKRKSPDEDSLEDVPDQKKQATDEKVTAKKQGSEKNAKRDSKIPYLTDDMLTSDDVLLGRGSHLVKWEGNVRFREVVFKRQPEYVSNVRHHVKDHIAREVISAIDARKGRFLRKVDTPEELASLGVPSDIKQAWVVADEAAMLEKVKQAFRDRCKKPAHQVNEEHIAAAAAVAAASLQGSGHAGAGAADALWLRNQRMTAAAAATAEQEHKQRTFQLQLLLHQQNAQRLAQLQEQQQEYNFLAPSSVSAPSSSRGAMARECAVSGLLPKRQPFHGSDTDRTNLGLGMDHHLRHRLSASLDPRNPTLSHHNLGPRGMGAPSSAGAETDLDHLRSQAMADLQAANRRLAHIEFAAEMREQQQQHADVRRLQQQQQQQQQQRHDHLMALSRSTGLSDLMRLPQNASAISRRQLETAGLRGATTRVPPLSAMDLLAQRRRDLLAEQESYSNLAPQGGGMPLDLNRADWNRLSASRDSLAHASPAPTAADLLRVQAAIVAADAARMRQGGNGTSVSAMPMAHATLDGTDRKDS